MQFSSPQAPKAACSDQAANGSLSHEKMAKESSLQIEQHHQPTNTLVFN